MAISITIITILLIIIICLVTYERIVCKEVCTIFCNSLVFIDQLCGINNDILNLWRKYGLRLASNEPIGYYEIKSFKDELLFRQKEADELYDSFIPLDYQPSLLKSIVLVRHKLNHQEVKAGISIAKTTYIELSDNIKSLLGVLNNETKTISSWSFGEKILSCFQHTSNMLFYGALESFCSFPHGTLEMYEQQSPRMKFLPTEIGLKKRKADYFQFQEMEAQKAEDLMHAVAFQLEHDKMSIECIASSLFRKDLYFFIAGSKKLQTERDLFSNVVSQLQTKWAPKNINIYGLSYQNFEHGFKIGGHQLEYNEFIECFADVAIFVLNGGKVGNETLKEFRIAMNAFKKSKRPTIFVYSQTEETVSDDVRDMHDAINEEKQYWQDYGSNNELRLMLQNDLTEYLQKTFEEMIQKQKEVLGHDLS